MAKQKRKRSKRAAPKAPKPQSPSTKVDELVVAAEKDLSEEDLANLDAAPPPVEELSLEAILKRGKEALRLLEIQRSRHETQAGKLAQLQEVTEEKEGKLNDRDAELDAREAQLKKQGAELTTLEEELAPRELDADAGFVKRNRDWLKDLDKEARAIKKLIAGQREGMVAERLAHEAGLAEKQGDLDKLVELAAEVQGPSGLRAAVHSRSIPIGLSKVECEKSDLLCS